MAGPDAHGPAPVVVITGASSGIGRATALRLAREGARLVLAARRGDVLRDVAARCEALGGQALPVAVDIADARQVDRLAAAAATRFGRIDVWFNNAGVVLLGTVWDAPPAEFRRVLETNLLGCLYGARAALRQFRVQGSGTLINMGSVLGVVSEPFAGAYVASKFGVRALGACLRDEVRDTPGIRVCTLLPAVVDTPIFRNAANRTGWRVQAVPPVYDPARVAEVVLDTIRRPRDEIPVGGFAFLLIGVHAVAPRLLARALATVGPWMQFWPVPAPPSSGNLFAGASDGGPVRDGWRRVPLHAPVPFWLAVLAVAAGGAFGLARLGRRVARH